VFWRKKPEVLVVGAGPVGLFASLLLARRGVRFQVVDKEWRTATRSYALALHSESLQQFDQLGLLDRVLEHARRIRTLGIYRGNERSGEVRISDLGEDYSFLAVLPQHQLEAILVHAIEEAGAKVEWNQEFANFTMRGEKVSANLETWDKDSLGYAVSHTEWVLAKRRAVEADFVIGADGHRSRVRQALGIDFSVVGEKKDFAVFEFATDADLGSEMSLILDRGTTSMCWPLPDGRCRWSFQIPHEDSFATLREKDREVSRIGAELYPMLDRKHLLDLLEERAPWFRGEVGDIEWRIMTSFTPRLAERFGKGRLWLAGDAGHVTGPVGMQSMNVGLREASDLVDSITGVLRGKIGAASLEQYHRARRSEW